ncbi:MAG: hypothetical protein A3G37_00070 [Omnitrophica WOR_2 bacterium RIFCSPLOWO2_12_FULL_46_30]|nr:MAG: hypothetical protein A3D27_03090 [Omnitrophica WOR_2 bacterium RIFCSPHIGHO2_02_FULL_46_37]OGX42583.1 MAG: hypothetical protein A3H41_03890 [Omnitrophica WOR_2 bacterium RIFCSPLOWO2_02_FULL_45_28]OGX51502.1 MAG: hypothetical protein A3G37_00070 [Omnitrophica WOR_2 bacterium RIFCSPLOWO2_12_FULL_46_30]
MKIWLNGKFINEEEAKANILDPGFLYGQGVFETMRAYSADVFRLDSHIERLFNALTLVNIKSDIKPELLKKAVRQSLKENGLKDAYLRLTAWQGIEKVNIAILARSYDFFKEMDYRKGFKAIISKTFRQNESSPLAKIKSSNCLHLLLAYQEARRNNADEALLLDTRGFLAEASRANIFIVKDNSLLTPSLDCGCLAGITRDTVLALTRGKKLRAVEAKINREDLEKADEAFLTNSLIEIMPLVWIDGRPIKKGRPGPITELLLEGYRSLL